MPGLLPISESHAETASTGYDSALTSDSDDEEKYQRENSRASIMDWRDPFEHMTLEEVEMQLYLQTEANYEKKKETEMYEGYLERHRLREQARKIEMRKASRIAMGTEAEAKAYAEEEEEQARKKTTSAGSIKLNKGSRRRSRRSGIQKVSSKDSGPLTLKTAEKIHIASDKLTEVERSTGYEVRYLQSLVANADAATDEGVEQMVAIDQYARRFDRWVLGKTDYHGRYGSERWAQYAKERRDCDANQADDLHQRQAVTRAQLKKAAETLEQEDQMDSITPVDFEQERIKNAQYNEVLGVSAINVVDHKRRVTDATIQINRKMHGLKVTTACNSDLEASIERVTQMKQTLNKEMTNVVEETDRLKLTSTDLKTQIEDFRAPSVLEFLQYVSKLNLANANVKIWSRKLNIAEVVNRTQKVAWRTAKVEAARLGREIGSYSESSYGIDASAVLEM